ncbi:Na+-dependent transporters of the SNF family [Hafnia alvei]|uniref:Transporter n=1 Tax=Hafnia alvei TaxID=569 RepID=A0A377PR50_HAFAL|nr:Na+-dependent transporters of the SNF family [Hafnia alvei]
MSQQWSSRIGHILAAAGSAIGIGAIWKFPYVSATNGGGAFLIVFFGVQFYAGSGRIHGGDAAGQPYPRGRGKGI